MSKSILTREELMMIGDAERAWLRAEVEANTGTDPGLLIAELRTVAEDMTRVADEIEARIGARRVD